MKLTISCGDKSATLPDGAYLLMDEKYVKIIFKVLEGEK